MKFTAICKSKPTHQIFSIHRTFASNKVARANERVSGDVIRGKTFARTSPHPALQFRLRFRKYNKVNIFHLRCVPVTRIATASSESAVFMYHCLQFQLSHYGKHDVVCPHMLMRGFLMLFIVIAKCAIDSSCIFKYFSRQLVYSPVSHFT